jgi:hypothetical protein
VLTRQNRQDLEALLRDTEVQFGPLRGRMLIEKNSRKLAALHSCYQALLEVRDKAQAAIAQDLGDEDPPNPRLRPRPAPLHALLGAYLAAKEPMA